MAIAVLIIGKSGSGKSTSLRNFGEKELGLINVIGKPLPFRKKFENVVISDKYEIIKKCLSKTEKKSIVIDDAGYLITNTFMNNHSTAGKGNGVFTLYNDIGDQFWRLIKHIESLEPQKIVYLIMHEDKSDLGDVKPKTIGKMLDEKVCVEGMFSIVLRSMFYDGEYIFKTKTDGSDVTKTPLELFDKSCIPNDLKAIDTAIRGFYSI